jgi:hypothetical protein
MRVSSPYCAPAIASRLVNTVGFYKNKTASRSGPLAASSWLARLFPLETGGSCRNHGKMIFAIA